MSSIREVAKLAGVSPSTVSRVMNGTANVDTQKKQRVLVAIQETGFRPNELARSLYKKSSKIIGVVIPTLENPFFNEMARIIEEEAYLQGYRFTFCNSNNDVAKEIDNIRVMTQMNADGMILMTNNEAIWDEVQDYKIPIVIMDRQLSGNHELACIQSDHYQGACLAIRHLIACGCKQIVNMRASQLLSSGRQRYKGYVDVCQEYNMPINYVECSYDYESGVDAAHQILKIYPNVDGIIAGNDMVALAVYKVLQQRGYRIPEDIQLIGFDDISLSSRVTPELTTISQPIREMGTLAARTIIDHVNGRKILKEKIFDVKLVKRETTRLP